MLINFSIQNFGSIKEKQTLSFEAGKSQHLEDYYVIEANGMRLLKLGLIYGANASGKTTILKALDFLHTLVINPKSKKTEILNFEPFLFDEKTPKEPTLFEIEFIQKEIRYFYKVTLTQYAILQEELYAYNPKKSNIFVRSIDAESLSTKITFGNKIKTSKVAKQTLESNTLSNNTVLGGFLKTNIEIQELKDVSDWFEYYLSDTIYSKDNLEDLMTFRIERTLKQKDFFVEILKNADFNIRDIVLKKEVLDFKNSNGPLGTVGMFLDMTKNLQEIGRNDSKYLLERKYEILSDNKIAVTNIEFEHSINDKNYSLKFGQESQGTQRYYGLAGVLYLLMINSTLFPIDELESSLHPDLFQHFLLSFLVNSKKSQLIATTHNREILNNKDIFRNDAIWITDKSNANCATELYSLADFDTTVIRDTSNIYNAYKLGKLGGVPNLGDYYIDTQQDEEK